MPPTSEERRLLNRWNAARHGWDCFQAGSRRATERLARKHHTSRQEKPDVREAP